jgi:hypothetical protein
MLFHCWHKHLSQRASADRQGEAVPGAKITRLNKIDAVPGDTAPEHPERG